MAFSSVYTRHDALHLCIRSQVIYGYEDDHVLSCELLLVDIPPLKCRYPTARSLRFLTVA
jgi:hypothetical protein